MTALLHGELIKARTTRTMLGYGALAFVVSVIFVLVATLSGDLASLAAAALSTIMGAAVGTLLRNQIAGVVGALVLTQMALPLISSIDESAAGFTPTGAANTLAGDGGAASLAPGWALLVLMAWTLALLGAAVFAERRRDLA